MVKAAAMAMKSLMKNRLSDFQGKDLDGPWPKYCVRHLSFTIPVEVLQKKVANNFEIAGSTKGIW